MHKGEIMFKKVLITLVTIFTAHAGLSQVSIALETNRKNYHQYEPVLVQLTLRSFSGTPLIFGSKDGLEGGVTFEIQEPGYANSNQSEYIKLDLKNLILRPGIPEKRQINLSKYLTLNEIGKYRIKAIINHEQLQNDYESNSAFLNSSKGFFVWSTTAGIPDVLGNNKNKIKSITYKIDSLFDGQDRVYYLVVEDEKKIYKVSRIGHDLGTSKPQCMVDNMSRLHIMIQDGVKIFSYYIYETSGERVSHDIYKKTSSSPHLSTDPDTGEIIVTGGKIAEKGTDYL